MKIIVSKTMVKALNAAAAALDMPHRFTYCECSYFEFMQKLNIIGCSCISGHDITKNNMIKYICVSYPDDYYAMNNYITFYDLEQAFIPGDTVQSFTNRIVKQYEI